MPSSLRGSRGDGHFMAGDDGAIFWDAVFVVAGLFPPPLLDDR